MSKFTLLSLAFILACSSITNNKKPSISLEINSNTIIENGTKKYFVCPYVKKEFLFKVELSEGRFDVYCDSDDQNTGFQIPYDQTDGGSDLFIGQSDGDNGQSWDFSSVLYRVGEKEILWIRKYGSYSFDSIVKGDKACVIERDTFYVWNKAKAIFEEDYEYNGLKPDRRIDSKMKANCNKLNEQYRRFKIKKLKNLQIQDKLFI